MKRRFRVRLKDRPCPLYLAAANTREVYRRLEREGIWRRDIASVTAYADAHPGLTVRPKCADVA